MTPELLASIKKAVNDDAHESYRFIASCRALLEYVAELLRAQKHQPHWSCKTHGDFDANIAVGCPECVRELRAKVSVSGEIVNTRREYTLSDEQLGKLIAACQPVPYIIVGGIAPSSPQERANHAWRALGDEMGFDYDTVQPRGSDNHNFTAVPK